MRVNANGSYRDMTAQEITDMRKQAMLDTIEASQRPLSAEEVTSMVIAQQINTLVVDDNTAVRMMAFYPTFDSIIGQTVSNGYKFTYSGRLWRVIQPSLTIQAHYAPGEGMESLYEQVNETHDGTMDDPIPYSGNLALESGKYYYQDSEIYLCFRDSVNPVYQPLSQLVGQFVEEATA